MVLVPATASAITTDQNGGNPTIVGLGDAAYDSVCHIEVMPGPTKDGDPRMRFPCSCVLVGDDVVITAAGCVKFSEDEEDVMEPSNINAVTFGTSVADGDAFAVSTIEIHRYFEPEGGVGYEVALLRLSAKPTDLGYPIAELLEPGDAIPETGDTVTLIGYGDLADDNRDSDGQRGGVEVPVRTVAFDNFLAGTEDNTTCRGDSGGAVFWDHDDNDGTPPKVAAFHIAFFSCFENQKRLRSDYFSESFIYPYVDRYNGACPAGGGCTTVGCRTPDPDCAENSCNWGNDCDETCDTRDWDCDIRSFAGDDCVGDGDCEEGGRCLTAQDDDTFKYCGRPCDQAGEVYQSCPENMACTDNDGTVECAYGTPSRGSQGWACALPEECRSGLCEGGFCAFDCVVGQTQCDVGFVCDTSTVDPNRTVCRTTALSGGGGFCSIGDGTNNLAGFLLIFGLCLVGFALGRRRRNQ
jgi:V8-like Glu-specific endopeptidase